MNFSLRISSVLLVVATCTMVLLTVLMHFKYHMTRSNLVVDRLYVALSGMVQPIENAIKLGVDMDNIKNLSKSIKNTKKFDPTIKNIIVFKTKNDEFEPIAYDENHALSDIEKQLLQKKIRASKTNYWNGTINEDFGFAGVSIKNVIGQDKGGILFYYDVHKIHMKEISEIQSLYKRLMIALIFIIVINFIAVFKNTASLNNVIITAEQSIFDILNNVGKKIDLGKIEEPVIKTQMRAMANKITSVGRYINKIELFLAQARNSAFEKEDSE